MLKHNYVHRHILGIAVLLFAFLSTGALAQDNELEEIIVKGTFSDGLGRSLDVKRNADTITDAIVGADIGKLPALNLAEALQRVPGVAITREAGEGQFVTVRGLGPNFQSVTFNGMPIAYNENIRDSGQSGRQFRFRTLPADLVEGLVVQKSPMAGTIDGGIGSSIDVLTVNPLDRDPFVTARVYGSWEERTSSFEPNGSASANWRNDDETFGLIGGVSFQSRDVQFDRFQNNAGYAERTVDGVAGILVPGEYATTIEDENRERVSFLGGVQWRPTDAFEVDLDVLYTEFNNEIAENRVLYEFGSRVETALAPNSARVENGVLRAGTINGGRVNRNAEFSDQSHENLAVSLSANYETDNWTLTPRFSYSNASSDLGTPLQRIDSRTTDSTGLVYGFDLGADPIDDRDIAALNTNLDILDPSAVPFRRYRIRPINSEDEDVSSAFDFERAFEGVNMGSIALTSFKGGVIYSDRFRDYDRRDRSLVPRTGIIVDGSFFDGSVPQDAFDDTIGTRSTWIGPNLDDFDDAFVVGGEFDGVRPQASDLVPTASDLRQSYQVDEEVLAFYGQLDFEAEWEGVPVSGNIGLRWVDTDTSVEGALVEAADDGAGGTTLVSSARITTGSYSELLPSVNLNFELTENVILRLAASKSLTRPSLADLRDATIPNSDVVSAVFENGAAGLLDPTLIFGGSGGNPVLDPYVALNVDVSLEWYFDDFGALTVSAFHKDIEDYIATDDRIETIELAVNGGSPIGVDFLISRPQNVGDAQISGIEVGFTNRMENGLGLAASLTLATSDIELNVSGGALAANLQGVSDVNYSVTPFFERGPFETHVSYTYRSKYFSNFAAGVQATPASGTVAVADGFGSLDFGASYQVNDNLDVFAEGVNMLDSRQVTYFGDEDLLAQIHRYGRTINIGVRASF